MQNFWTLLKREFKLFWQNKVLRLLFYQTPLLYGILLGYVYGKGKVTDLPIIVVDEDRSEEGNAEFDDNEVLDITSLLYDQNNLSKLS
jgi:ABC-2 type transport system permease protein